MRTAKEWEDLFTKNYLPEPPSSIVDARWIARSGDWYVRTAEGWFWLAVDRGRWVPCPNGPP